MQELKDKVAIVTGATRKRGLGRVIALTLAGGGANVVVTGNSRSASPIPEDEAASGWRGLPDVVAQIEAMGVQGQAIYADVTNSDEVQRMVRDTVDRFGRIDILVNNATYPHDQRWGGAQGGPLANTHHRSCHSASWSFIRTRRTRRTG